MTVASKPMGVSQVFLRPPIETLFKDRYFVSGSGIVIWFKDQAHEPYRASMKSVQELLNTQTDKKNTQKFYFNMFHLPKNFSSIRIAQVHPVNPETG